MSWWGKLIGGAFGFMLGGPLGALLGASLGHNFDKGLGRFDTYGGPQGGFDNEPDVARIQSAFFTATFSMMGYVAKADGVVTREEIELAETVMRQMRLNMQQRKVAISLFDKGKESGFPVDEVMEQFRKECHRRTNLLQMFLEIQIATAMADGTLHRDEERILRQIAGDIGFSTEEFSSILQRQRAGQHMHQQAPDSATALQDAYKMLGVEKQAPDAEIKKAYRRLMNQHHPDKLVSKGLPEEMMEMAHKKTLEIKEAYELIKRARAS